jgi:hypothetical protein
MLLAVEVDVVSGRWGKVVPAQIQADDGRYQHTH